MSTDYHAALRPLEHYHLYNKAVSGRKLFYTVMDYKRFLSKYKEYFSSYLETFAYCLIPNHFHFLVEVQEIDEVFQGSLKNEKTSAARRLLSDEIETDKFLSDQFRRFLSSHSLYVNKKYSYNGPLLLKKMKKTEVETDVKFYDLLCYIHHNPIHHGLSKTFADWPFSSFGEYMNEGIFVTSKKVLDELGAGNVNMGRSEFVNLHREFKENFNDGLASQ